MTENYNEVKPQTVKFNEVGDFIKGTLIAVEEMNKPDAYGKISSVYTVKSKEGKFLGSSKNEKTGKFVLDAKPTIIAEGEDWNFFLDNKSPVASQMKRVRLGQKFMIKFTELKPTDKGNDAKIRKVYPGTDEHGKPLMDAEWVAQNETIDSFGENK